MHSEFALRPHHVWKYGRRLVEDSLSNLRPLRLGEEKRNKKEEDKNHRAQIDIRY